MKKILSILTVFSLALLVMTSCSKDDDPKDNDLFVGTYEGRVTFIDGFDTNISDDNGSVRVVKVGDNYTFKFSNDIPDIEDVEIEKGENNFTLNWDEGSIITIDESNLNINMIKDGKLWTADCER